MSSRAPVTLVTWKDKNICYSTVSSLLYSTIKLNLHWLINKYGLILQAGHCEHILSSQTVKNCNFFLLSLSSFENERFNLLCSFWICFSLSGETKEMLLYEFDFFLCYQSLYSVTLEYLTFQHRRTSWKYSFLRNSCVFHIMFSETSTLNFMSNIKLK